MIFENCVYFKAGIGEEVKQWDYIRAINFILRNCM